MATPADMPGAETSGETVEGQPADTTEAEAGTTGEDQGTDTTEGGEDGDGLGDNGEHLEPGTVDYWKARAREQERKARDRGAELEQIRRDSMSDQERQVAEARDAARAETLAEVSGQLVAAEMRSMAADRSVNVDALLEGMDRSRFVSESGEVDRDGLRTWLDAVAPAPQQQQTGMAWADMGQGARGGNRSASPDDVFGRLVAGGLGME